jgi:hypothetical protein
MKRPKTLASVASLGAALPAAGQIVWVTGDPTTLDSGGDTWYLDGSGGETSLATLFGGNNYFPVWCV